MKLPAIEVDFDGESLSIDLSDFNALEWRELRLVTGLRTGDVFADLEAIDPYAVAGLIWLVKRRDDQTVEFDDIAKRVTVAHALTRDPDAKSGPQRRRRKLLAYLPSLATVCGIKPWEVDLLTSAELAEFLALIDKMGDAAGTSETG